MSQLGLDKCHSQRQMAQLGLDKCHSQRQMSQLCPDKCHSQRQNSQHYHDYQRQMSQTSDKCQSSLFHWLVQLPRSEPGFSFLSSRFLYWYVFIYTLGGGPRVVVSTAAFHASSGFGSRSRRFERSKNVSSPSTCESQFCGKPPWPRGSVLGLRPPGIVFRILCLEDSVISIISPSSGGSPGPV